MQEILYQSKGVDIFSKIFMDGEIWGDEMIFTYVKSLWLEDMNKTYRGSGQNPIIAGRVDMKSH